MKRSLLFLIVLTLCATAALFGQTTIYVNSTTGSNENDGLTPETAKATIQAGVDAAGTNGTVIVAQGDGYAGVVVIDSAGITIQAENPENKPTLTSGGTGLSVIYTVTGVSIKNFIIVPGEGNGIYAEGENDKLALVGNEIQGGLSNGISVGSGSDSILVSGNTVENVSGYGISLNDIDHSLITDNEVTNSGFTGIILDGYTDTLSNNTSNGNGQNGIFIHAGETYHVLINNTANENTGSGIYIENENGLTLTGNTTNTNQNGIFISNSVSFALSGNTANDNTGCGIYLQYSNSHDLFNNTVQGNAYGIYLYDGSSTNLVRNNTVTGNSNTGIILDTYVGSSAGNNTVWNNTITGNGSGIRVESGYENSISVNLITNNNDWGVNFQFNEDNVLVMNKIFGNNIDDGEGGGVYFSGEGGWLNAQHNWWGQAEGPTEADLPGPGSVITFYHKTSVNDISQPGIEVPGPVFLTGEDKVFPSLGAAATYVGEYGLSGALIQVRVAGLFENGVSFSPSGLQITGMGMNQSYLYVPYSGIYFISSCSTSAFSGFDVDAGSFFDPVSGNQGSFNYFGTTEGNVIEVAANEVLISNNRLRGAYNGIDIVSAANNVTVQSNEILWNYYNGVYVGSYGQTISNNLVYQNGHLVSQVEGSGPSGIYLYGNNLVTGNKIANNAGNGIYASDYYNTIENNIIGEVDLEPSVFLPDPIKWDSINITFDLKIVGSVSEQDVSVSHASVKSARQNRERLARFMPKLKEIETKQNGRHLSLAQLRTLLNERKATLDAEWKAAAPAYYAELKKIQQEQRAAQAELRKLRMSERKAGSGVPDPLFKSTGVFYTIPAFAMQSVLPGNSIHGIRVNSGGNSITENTITGNGTSFGRDPEDIYRKPEPAGVELSGYSNYFADNTISNNWFVGIKIHQYASQNVIWRNTISFNGHKTEGDGAGIFFGKYGGYGNSISTNTIADNVGHGVRIDSLETELVFSVGPSFSVYPTAYQNAIVYNNITGNTVSGIATEVSVYYPFTVNAQYNYWGDASGPAAASNPGGTGQSISDNVSYLFYRSTPVPPVTAEAPLMGDGTIPLRSFDHAGIFGDSMEELPISDHPIDVQQKKSSLTYSTVTLSDYTGLVAQYGLYLWYDGFTLNGGGKDETGNYKSYIFLPQSYISISANGVTIENLDLDGGGMLNVETGSWSPNTGSGYTYTIVQAVERSNPAIRFNRIRGSADEGIYLFYVVAAEIQGNEFFWNRRSGIHDYYGYDNSSINENKFFENGDINYEGPMAGIVLENSEGLFVSGNEVFNNVVNGMYLWGSIDNVITGNMVHSNGALGYFEGSFEHPSGIVLPMNNANNLIEQNTVVNNVRHGIRVGTPYSEGDPNNVGNVIQNNLVGAGGVSPSIKPININDLQTKVNPNGSQTLTGLLQPGRSNFSGGALAFKRQGWENDARGALADQLRKNYRMRREDSKKQRISPRRPNEVAGAVNSDGQSVSKISPEQEIKLRLSSARSSYAVTKQAAVVTELPGNWETGISLVRAIGTMVLGNTVVGNGWGVEDVENGPAELSAGISLLEGDLTFVLGNTINDNKNVGINVDSNSSSGAALNGFLGNQDYGVFNVTVDSSFVFFASGNYWGAENGPSGGVNDPMTGLPANGDGDAISGNVLFDPYVPFGPEQLSAAALYAGVTYERMLGGIQFDFTTTGSGGILAVAQFNSAPISDPISDGEGGFYAFGERYWEILNVGMDSVDVNLTFDYSGLSNGVYRLYYRENFAPVDSPWTAFPEEQTVQNGIEKTVTANDVTGFSQWALVKVANAAPTVSQIAPSSGVRGAKTVVSFTGEDFDPIGTTVDFGANIVVDSLTSLSLNSFDAHISISVSAQTGMRGVTVTTAAGISEPDSFMVNNPVPTITGVAPTSLSQGGSTTVTITGTGLLPGATGTKVSFGAGITAVGDPTLNGADLQVNIEVSPTATVGTRNVSVTNDPPGGGTNQLASAFTVTTPTSVERLDEIPTKFDLLQNFPNPFNPTTTIRFSVPEASNVRMVLYNMLGSEVKVFVNESLAPGVYQYHVRAEDLPSGMYIYRITATPSVGSETKPYSSSRKLVLVK
ncbi:MAG: right-handed parallel beta-helix repeat-containing protein [Ignavibacteriae bacterium]|nr:right-handed parallel beta-helix repeat-containing protein [Ignavibacteriota bacterium]